jgi:regulator of nucleoside diphosphate kinase
MSTILDGGLAESLSAVWSTLHRDAQFVIQEDEIHHLRMLALAADDDLVSLLLLRKLRIAQVVGGASIPDSLVSLNSFCEFSFDGGHERFCQLVRPSPYAPSYGLSILTLTGAGLVGLRAGQTILWPNEAGELRDLHVARVENCPGLSDWLGAAPEKDRVNV